ncbi:MAG: glycyl radical protein [Anaerovoracaceae bacterium]
MAKHLTDAAEQRLLFLRNEMLTTPEVCIQKAKYTTESYKQTEGAPFHYRRAKALENVLTHLTVGIGDQELIVGRPTGKKRGGPLSPEVNSSWYTKEMDSFHTREQENYAEVSAEDKKVITECCEYWKGKSLFDRWNAAIPDDLKFANGPIIGGGGFCLNTQYFGHISTDFEVVMQKGIHGIKKEIDETIAKLMEDTIGNVDSFDKIQYLESMKISLNAVVTFANRYADLAEEMAEKETDIQRKAELKQIAVNCRRVPEFPPESFHQALQAAWFMYIGLNNEAWGAGPSMARVDQYLYPFFKADLDAGKITEEDAVELVGCFLIRQNGQFTVYSTPAAKIYGGLSSRLGNTIGGNKADGSCAVNELSYVFMYAARYGLTEDLMIMTSDNTPQDFVEEAVRTAAYLRGKMKFIGTNVVVDQFLSMGRPLEVANTCAITGCNSPSVPGYSLDLPGGMINMPLIFDLALHNGVSPMLGKKFGIETGDARQFTTFDQVYDAFKAQFRYLVPYMHLYKNMDKKMFQLYSPCPLQSALMRGCIEKAQDITDGAATYISFAMSLSGAPNMGDGLYALKKLVFEDKKYTMAQVMDALDANWEGYDEMYRDFSSLPKFGNDIPEVDAMVNDVLEFCSAEVAKIPGPFGAKSICAAATITGNIQMGADTGAQPDGRHAGEPISEGGISPHQGRNNSGVTATMASVAKLNPLSFCNGSVLNIRINPDAVADDDKIRKLATLISIFHKMGGFLVQFNIVSTETLREAQKNPEQYKDLLVRVSTYSAYFVELSTTLQNDIIARMEFENV